MNDAASDQPPGDPPVAASRVQPRRPFHWVWLIPIVVAAVGAYLAYEAISQEGPRIVVDFNSGDGLTAGQTKVKHKAVELGTVRSVDLSRDMSHVVVRIDMTRNAARVLTDKARFWVVRPRFNASNISGLDTLVSGSYIELDPGPAGGKPVTHFVGLEEPPAVRSDEPGHNFDVTADRIGSLASGSPVFFRDITAGEVLGYDLGPQGRGVTLHVFVRAPFDGFVRQNTHFWNTSGIDFQLGADGVRIRVASLQAVLSGGIAFDVPPSAPEGSPSPPGSRFKLFPDETTADAAGFSQQIPFVTYFEGSVRGLEVGSHVELYGIQIGTVTGVHLQFDPTGQKTRVQVTFQVQPERILSADEIRREPPLEVSRNLIRHGLHVQLSTSNYLTGQMVLAMQFTAPPPGAPAEVAQEGNAIVLPSANGGLDNITTNLSDIASKLGKLPLDEIAANLNDTLKGVDRLANGPDLKQALQSLAGTMSSAQELIRKVDAGATPLLRRLPEIAQELQATVARASGLVASADTGYGANSEFKRDLERLLVQVSDTARSVRLLADFLDQHPEALIRGRTERASER